MKIQDRLMFESAKKRFNTILEYVSAGDAMNEDGEGQPQDPSAMGGDPSAMGADPSMMGGDPSAMGGMPQDPSAMGGMPQDPSMAGGDPSAAMGGGAGGPQGFNPQDPSAMGGDPSAMGADPSMMGGMPQDPSMAGGDPSAMGGEQPGADDDVVDITQLTDKQDETQHDIAHLDNKFSKIMKAIGSFEELLRQNDEKLEDLKSEFERRNPTQIEKLGMQTAKSYPFNVTPEEYWKDKEATSNYRVEPDDNGKEQGQYVITKDDIDGNVDWKGIADSLDDDDVDDNILRNQTLKNIIGI